MKYETEEDKKDRALGTNRNMTKDLTSVPLETLSKKKNRIDF